MALRYPDPHIGLAVAAAVAYERLSEKPRAFYDAQHFSEVLCLVAQALIRVAPLYIAQAGTDARRKLADEEALHAAVTRGATVVVLADGRRLTGLSVLRSDLRAAIAVLKRAGIKDFPPARFSRA